MISSTTLRASVLAAAVAASMLAPVGSAAGSEAVSSTSNTSVQGIELDREDLSHIILEVWETQVPTLERAEWRERMSVRLAQSDPHNLRHAADALDYDEMLAALSGVRPTGEAGQPQSIGDLDRDLTFTPVEPCRIVDTRLAGGRIGADSQRDFIGSTSTDFTMQGGSDTDCNLPQGVAALSVNLTIVAPESAGYAVAFPFGVESPLAASVNYADGSVIGNEVVVPMAQGESSDFSIYTFRSAHAVADVTGYYMRPQATELNCTAVDERHSIEPGEMYAGFISCPVGYSATGGACTSGTASLQSAQDLVIGASEPGLIRPRDWYCIVHNTGEVPQSVRQMARCCRVPGR